MIADRNHQRLVNLRGGDGAEFTPSWDLKCLLGYHADNITDPSSYAVWSVRTVDTMSKDHTGRIFVGIGSLKSPPDMGYIAVLNQEDWARPCGGPAAADEMPCNRALRDVFPIGRRFPHEIQVAPGPDGPADYVYVAAVDSHDPEVAEGIGALTRYKRKGGAATKMDDSVGGGPQRWTGHWTTNPAAVPSSKTVDGPLLGDGETGVVLGVSAATGALTAYISTNSFWLLNSDKCGPDGHCQGSHRAGIGGVTLAAANATTQQPLFPKYSLEQSLNGTVGFTLRDPSTADALLRGTMLISQGSGGATTLITTLTGAAASLDLSWSTWAFGNGDAVKSSMQGSVAFASRTLDGTAQPVTGVITSRLLGAEQLSASPTGCGSRMAGRWMVQGLPHPVVLEHAAGTPADAFLWNNSLGDWRDDGWLTANGTANDTTVTLQYNRYEPAGCSGVCSPPTPHGCVCVFVGTFDANTCDHFTLNHARWTRMGAPAPRQAINFTAGPQTSATIVSTVLTSLTTNSAPPLPLAVNANQAADVAALSAQAKKFWSSFWSKSSVSLPTRPELERFWFSAQYLMGMASRLGRVAPGLWGPWVSTDAPAWCGGCKSLDVLEFVCALQSR